MGDWYVWIYIGGILIVFFFNESVMVINKKIVNILDEIKEKLVFLDIVFV